ncbi:hypothetical protein RP20_CCG013927 [Aedes albopictus]|nr:hypothetical protein RP20_CCG013927 [Aedes albopictus]
MEPRRRLRPIVIICLFLTIAGIIGFGYFCPDQVCALSRREVISNQELITGYEHDNLGKPVQQNLLANPGLSYEEVLNDDFQFDMNAHDVMVFLHIQKTGGTSFGKHLVRDLDLKVRRVEMIARVDELSVNVRFHQMNPNVTIRCNVFRLQDHAACLGQRIVIAENRPRMRIYS